MNIFPTIDTLTDRRSGKSESVEHLVSNGDWLFTQLGHKTSASPLVVSNGTTTKITFQPVDISYTAGNGLNMSYDFTNQKFLPLVLNDLFNVEVRFKVKSSAQNSHLDLKLESPTFAFNPINAQTHTIVHSANDEQFLSANFLVFIGADLITNGIEFKITAHDGNMSIYDISYLIVRLSSGK